MMRAIRNAVLVAVAVTGSGAVHADAASDESRRQAIMASSRASAAAIDRRNSDQAFQAGLASASSRGSPSNSGSSSTSSGNAPVGGTFGGSSGSSGPQSVVSTKIVRVWVGETLSAMATRLAGEAAAGNANSGYLLGRMNYTGYGTAPSHAKARELFIAAAGQQHVEASFHAGEMMVKGIGGPVDKPRGMAALQFASEAGNADAQAYLGLRIATEAFETGDNSQMAKAVQYLEQSALAGRALAQSTLGSMLYFHGIGGVAADGVKAVKYLRMGVEQGDPISLYALGNLMVDGDPWTGLNQSEGWEYIERAAQAGNGRAMWKLGAAKVYGTLGQQANIAEAVRLLRLSAEDGDRNGQADWGKMLYSGLGVAENKADGIRFTRLAAEAQHLEAQLDMARMNYFGDIGILPNLGESARWARLSAEGGSADAALFYGLLLYSGEGVAKDPKEALRWMRKAAALGNAEAAKNLTEPEMQVIAKTMDD